MGIRANRIFFKGTIKHRNFSESLLFDSGDYVIVERTIPRLFVLRCPCGCGDDLLINLDSRSGPAWRIYSKSGLISLFPSYWRDSACGSHFIIWNNKVYWFYGENDTDVDSTVNHRIEDQVLKALKKNKFTHYLKLSDVCGLIPWEVLQACKQLSRKGLCIPKNGLPQEFFKKSNIAKT